jgi:hypothetical protein
MTYYSDMTPEELKIKVNGFLGDVVMPRADMCGQTLQQFIWKPVLKDLIKAYLSGMFELSEIETMLDTLVAINMAATVEDIEDLHELARNVNRELNAALKL